MKLPQSRHVVANVVPRLSARVRFGNETGVNAQEYSSGHEGVTCGWLVPNSGCARPSPTTVGRSLNIRLTLLQ